MPRRAGAPASVLDVRPWLADLRARDGPGPDTVVLAVDGLPASLAHRALRATHVHTVSTVLPTSSYPGWLSSLTGVPVAEHGVPGVVFADPDDGRPVRLRRGCGHRPPAGAGTVFTDARRDGLRPVAVTNDLEGWRNGVTDTMLAGAEVDVGRPYFEPGDEVAPERAVALLAGRVEAALHRDGGGPHLVWVFVELDRHVHRHGYDAVADRWLAGLQRLAERLVARGRRVVLHADHGLVETEGDAQLRAEYEAVVDRWGARAGGAGRTCWVSARPGCLEPLRDALGRLLGDLADVLDVDAVYPAGSRAARAVGDLLVVARGRRFLTAPRDRFEHGSRLVDEVEVPLALWEPR